MVKTIIVGGKELMFSTTAANDDIHLFINGLHDPKVCIECIQPGTLVETAAKEGSNNHDK